MKKTYISPATTITKVQVSHMLLTLSTTANPAKVEGGNVTMESRENNAWDIWGNDNDFED